MVDRQDKPASLGLVTTRLRTGLAGLEAEAPTTVHTPPTRVSAIASEPYIGTVRPETLACRGVAFKDPTGVGAKPRVRKRRK